MMKRIFIWSILAAGMLMQSCGEDKVLTDLSLRNESLALPVGERSRIKVTFTPTDADNVTLMWSSSNESVATVSDDGILTVVGVGTAVITVSSGSISKTVHVEGTIRSLAITAPEETKIRVGAEFTLSAIPDPSDIQVAAVWSSDNEAVATVNASTGEVTVVGNGTANIQATVGSVVSSYAVVCEDLLDSAAGYWEFDDPNDIGKAIKGSSLKPQGEGIRWVEGPSDENLAIEVPMHEYFIADLSGATPNGGSEDDRTHKRVYQWSMMMDFRFPTVKGYYYTQHGGVNMSDGDFFVRYNNDQMLAGKGTYIPFFEADPNQPYTAWVRLVITCDNGTMRMYCNGVETDGGGLSYPLALSIDPRYSLPTDGPLYIFGEPKGTTSDGKPDFSASDDDSPFPCAAIAFWDKTLTAGQVKALGSIAH